MASDNKLVLNHDNVFLKNEDIISKPDYEVVDVEIPEFGLTQSVVFVFGKVSKQVKDEINQQADQFLDGLTCPDLAIVAVSNSALYIQCILDAIPKSPLLEPVENGGEPREYFRLSSDNLSQLDANTHPIDIDEKRAREIVTKALSDAANKIFKEKYAAKGYVVNPFVSDAIYKMPNLDSREFVNATGISTQPVFQ